MKKSFKDICKKTDKNGGNRENQSTEEFHQDLSQSQPAGMVFVIQLLMKEPVKMPDKEHMITVMKKHLSEVDCFTYDKKCAGFAVTKYEAEFKEEKIPPQLMIMESVKFDDSKIEAFERRQLWNCENSEQILKDCHYQVVAMDMLAAGLSAKERAELDMDFLEAVVELYPECEAVYLLSCGKMFTADDVRNHQIPREARFIYFGVNVRFFNIQGTNDMLIDTLGMGTLFLPDIQYHFHDMEPDWIVNHAYDIASYIFENDDPIQSGDVVDGIVDGKISRDVQWKCQYENALIQPARQVLDVNMGEYAAGTRG
ncbi:MAG: DUF4261 domain-containing protein [Lachnospiraceae bacterium]|nr:DUF4261 domain-containing protein [Lachnospiraceae bacterium]